MTINTPPPQSPHVMLFGLKKNLKSKLTSTRGSNPRPSDCKSILLTTKPHGKVPTKTIIDNISYDHFIVYFERKYVTL